MGKYTLIVLTPHFRNRIEQKCVSAANNNQSDRDRDRERERDSDAENSA
jgi:hypothetical protein